MTYENELKIKKLVNQLNSYLDTYDNETKDDDRPDFWQGEIEGTIEEMYEIINE